MSLSTHGSRSSRVQAQLASRQFQQSLSQRNDKEMLDTKIQDGFRSSAYWGATGKVPPREVDDAVNGDAFRFTAEINKKLVPFPEVYGAAGTSLYAPTIGYHITPGVVLGSEATQSQLLKESGYGDDDGSQGKNPLKFLYLQTTQQRAAGKFDAPVQQLAAERRAADGKFFAERDHLRNSAYQTVDPLQYRLTSQDYCDVSGVDPSSYRVTALDTEQGVDEFGNSVSGPDVYKSRYNLVHREGPARRAKTSEQIKQGTCVDLDHLHKQQQSTLSTMLPSTFVKHSGETWMTTNQYFHAPYDTRAAADANDRNATVPAPNRCDAFTQQEWESSRAFAASSRASQLESHKSTEYGEHYQDRQQMASVEQSFKGRSVFDIRYGVPTMESHAHHPRDDVQTGDFYMPSQMVPGQYVSMAQRSIHVAER